MKSIMKKLTMFILLIIVNISFAISQEQNKIILLDLNYNNGEITINKILTKMGYYPDRKDQPLDGYKLDLVSINNDILYSFRFDVPLTIYTDVIINNKISGNIIKLNNTDFALIMPYFDNLKEINIYDKNNKRVTTKEFTSPSKKQNLRHIYLFVGMTILVFSILYLVLRHYKKE
jgi:hypothetical protein